MPKSLKFDRVGNLDYLSAYEVIEKLVEMFSIEDVQAALNEIAAQQSVQADVCPECGGDGADHEDSSKDCFECGGSGKRR